jgi:hypothetical protein
MAKRSAANKQQLSKKHTNHGDASVSTTTATDSTSPASQSLPSTNLNGASASSSSSFSSSILVIAACLFLAGVEIYQLFELLQTSDYTLTPKFWDESWEIVKKNWQSKLLAVMFFLKTFYMSNQPQAPTQRVA